MARIKKVSDNEIADALGLAYQHGQKVFDIAEKGWQNGFDSMPSMETALELLRFGSAFTDLAQVAFSRIYVDQREARTRADLEKLYRERAAK